VDSEHNTNAYVLFLRIEVGLREFLIKVIAQNGVPEWYNTFLGSSVRAKLNDFADYVKRQEPEIELAYLFKIRRASKESLPQLKLGRLYHPFYYLDWKEMEDLIRQKDNSALIDKSIGKRERERLADQLSDLRNYRNDIAHSRFISEDEFKFIKSSFDQIALLIPGFDGLYTQQTTEQKLSDLFYSLTHYLENVIRQDMLSIEEINVFIKLLEQCINSFWLNAIQSDLISRFIELRDQMWKYEKYRQTPGGLLDITQWKKNNYDFLILLKLELDGKI